MARSFNDLQAIRRHEGEASYLRALREDEAADDNALGVQHFETFLKVLDTLSNPAKSQKLANDCIDRLTKLADTQVSLKAAQDKHAARVAADEKRLQEDRDDHERRVAAKEAELEQRDAKTRTDANIAAKAASEAVTLKSQLEAKLSRIREATGL
jgi:hypothetical protein